MIVTFQGTAHLGGSFLTASLGGAVTPQTQTINLKT